MFKYLQTLKIKYSWTEIASKLDTIFELVNRKNIYGELPNPDYRLTSKIGGKSRVLLVLKYYYELAFKNRMRDK